MKPAIKLPADERRNVTVEAVIKLAGLQNPNEITTAAIASHMNLTQGALFRHFPTKDAIWKAVMEWVTEHLFHRIDQATRGMASPIMAMHAIFMSHIEFVVEHPGVPRMLFGELQRAESTPAKCIAQQFIQSYANHLMTYIERGKACGEIAPELDTHAAAMLFIGAIQGLVMQSMLYGDLQRMRADAPSVFELFQRSVGSAK